MPDDDAVAPDRRDVPVEREDQRKVSAAAEDDAHAGDLQCRAVTSRPERVRAEKNEDDDRCDREHGGTPSREQRRADDQRIGPFLDRRAAYSAQHVLVVATLQSNATVRLVREACGNRCKRGTR